MTIITRFAPSPTGRLHVGNIRTALICYMFAKSNNGKFMLRIDDTDKERSKKEYVNFIEEDLKWLGLDWDIQSFQSSRIEKYNEIKNQLIESGFLYDCYESVEEIEMKRKLLLSRGMPPIYDRAALKLTANDKERLRNEGRKPYWRFKLDTSKLIKWDDQIKGSISFESKHLSDPVLIRADGTMTYMLPSTIDDIDFAITNIIRGEDHISNTAIQIHLFDSLGSKIPNFAHHSLMKTKDGKISKREGGFDINSLRENVIHPMAINSLMINIGTSDSVKYYSSNDEILKSFDLKKLSKGSVIYDFSDLERLNSKVTHNMTYSEVNQYKDLKKIDENFWYSVRLNISNINEVNEWWKICREEVEPIIEKEDIEYIKIASSLLPKLPWNESTWNEWVKKIKENSDRKGKNLFMPLRKALTSREDGPNLQQILLLIGEEKSRARLEGKTA